MFSHEQILKLCSKQREDRENGKAISKYSVNKTGVRAIQCLSDAVENGQAMITGSSKGAKHVEQTNSPIIKL